jgi:hypothetical protein
MKRVAVTGLVVATLLAVAGSAQAIVYGQPDGNRHPYVGALVAEWQEPGRPDLFCSGTLISPTVFLTASHCTAALADMGIEPDEVWVTFDATFDEDSPLLPGTYHTHPEFGFSGPGGRSDPHDIAVIVLDAPVSGITPARLPTLNLLDTLDLRRQRFTAVGYGTVRETRRGGPQNILENTERRFAAQSFMSLTKSWLNLSMNQATGDGGTCYGDSGGPHFLGDSNLIVSITVTGDAVCKASDVTYRVDTASARAFLDDFVAVP